MRISYLTFLLLFLVSTILSGQDKITVKGVVTDTDKGEPLPFVTVSEKGTTNGTVTSEEGKYSLNVDPNGTLVFSYVGYLSEEVPVSNRTNIDMSMVLDLQELDEVVVVGYGTQKKSDLTGSVVSVSSEDLDDIKATNFESMLQGKASGVQVTNKSGSPGAPVSVKIRGMGTLNSGSTPLYVVDGYIMGDQNFGKVGGNTPDNKMTMSFLDPNDIASIEILKDASAAAIYGARGANGVVLITTKSGEEGRTQFSFDAYYGQQSFDYSRKFDVMNGPDFRDYEIANFKARYGDGWLFLATDPASPQPRRRFVDESGNPLPVDSYDWQDQLFETAPIQNYRLSFRGGTEKNNYFVSMGYNTQEGIIPNSSFEKFTSRVKGSHKLADFVKIGENLSFGKVSRDRIIEQAGNSAKTALVDPTVPPKNEEGDWVYPYYTPFTNNPIFNIVRDEYDYESFQYMGNVFAEVDILPTLQLYLSAGGDVTEGLMESFDPSYRIGDEAKETNDYRHREERWINWNLESRLTYRKLFGANHDFSAMVAVTRQRESFTDWRFYSGSWPSDNPILRYPDIGNQADLVSLMESDPLEYRLQSYLGRLNYSFRNKYLVTASLRRDGSTNFGPERRWGNFPSFSLGYKISEEQFMKNIVFINFAKIRAGWGILGNQSIAPFQYKTFVAIVTHPFGGIGGGDENVYRGSMPDGWANEAIHWEESSQTNVAIDLGMFDNKLNFTVEYFQKNVYDLLFQVPVPTYTGLQNPDRTSEQAPAPDRNAAEMKNTGYEFAATYKYTVGDFNFSLSGNISFIDNEVLKIGRGALPQRTNSLNNLGFVSKTEPGSPVAGFYGYIVDGLFQNYEDIANSPFQGPQDPYVSGNATEPDPDNWVAPGDYKFKDIDGNDTINSFDQTYIGSPLPDFTYGLSLNAGYKILDFSVLFTGSEGNEIVNPFRYYLYGYSFTNKAADLKGNHWTEENPSAEYPRIGINKNDNYRFSDFYVEDGSYLRIKNITLGVSLPENIIGRAGLNEFRIYFSVQNVYTFTGYTGMEPELGNVGWNPQPLELGVDRGTYPQPRIYMAGVNLTF